MDKKEFLSFSLPYGLKFKDTFRNSINLLTGIKSNDNDSNYEGGVYSNGCYMSWINCTPILHPMSDLTKLIEHNGEKFVPLHRLLEHSYFNLGAMTNKDIMEFADIYSNVDLITVNDLPLYLEWKFDIAGLIDKNEAIDVNTLEINPYK